MSGDVVIRAEGLGKKYTIGHEQVESVRTLRDTIMRGLGNFARSTRAMLHGQQIVAGDEIEDFWALRNLDFEIRRGDVVGVIGRNGAGKSTLLKVLSRITEPTEGRVTIRGRVASLLEVGTGFHPELSGRENIYLNGAILGMSRAEIRRKFDEIVAFSEVERFLDTPVKRYSSGMYVRLAFAVAAHLEPEILIVDEVLAVGDAEFQKKCLGKMQDVAGHGRTVLFVSHNIGMIGQLCTSGIHLSGGRVVHRGPIRECIASLFSREEHGSVYDFDRQGAKPSITRFEYDEQELRSGVLKAKIDVEMASEDSGNLYLGLILKSSSGVPVWGSSSQIHGNIRQGRMASGTFKCLTPTLPLSAGQYLLSIWLNNDNGVLDTRIDALSLFLEHHPLQAGRPGGDVMGFMELPAQWAFSSATVEVAS